MKRLALMLCLTFPCAEPALATGPVRVSQYVMMKSRSDSPFGHELRPRLSLSVDGEEICEAYGAVSFGNPFIAVTVEVARNCETVILSRKPDEATVWVEVKYNNRHVGFFEMPSRIALKRAQNLLKKSEKTILKKDRTIEKTKGQVTSLEKTGEELAKQIGAEIKAIEEENEEDAETIQILEDQIVKLRNKRNLRKLRKKDLENALKNASKDAKN